LSYSSEALWTRIQKTLNCEFHNYNRNIEDFTNEETRQLECVSKSMWITAALLEGKRPCTARYRDYIRTSSNVRLYFIFNNFHFQLLFRRIFSLWQVPLVCFKIQLCPCSHPVPPHVQLIHALLLWSNI
jgi:hypothetical protein